MGRRRTGGVRKRRGKWQLRYYVGDDRIEECSGTGDRRAAEQLLRQRQREVEAGTWIAPAERPQVARVERLEVELAAARAALPAAGPTELTLARYLAERAPRRHADGVRSAKTEDQYWRDFVGVPLAEGLPALGSMVLAAITREDIRAFVVALRAHTSAKTGRKLGPRTVLNVYRALSTAFLEATERRPPLIASNPCTLRTRRGELPKKRDVVPGQRAEAVYERHEAEQLISDERIPLDRRAYYAAELLAGVRTSESAGLRLGDYDRASRPLGRITVARQADGPRGERDTKTGEIRVVPVHPTLALVLNEWIDVGWPLLFGRRPQPSDPLFPSRADRTGRSFRVPSTMWERLIEDQKRIGMRRVPWAQHAMRATFLTLLEVDGANMAIARRATHAAPADVVGGYIRTGWVHLCAEIGKLQLEHRRAEILPLRPAASRVVSGADSGADFGARRPVILDGSAFPGANPMGPAGVEHERRSGTRGNRAHYRAKVAGDAPQKTAGMRGSPRGQMHTGAVAPSGPDIRALENAVRTLRTMGQDQRAAAIESVLRQHRGTVPRAVEAPAAPARRRR